ncbi:MAG: hypothetical protein IT318_27030 [Anaerolineales bacterium]|nr:hypothetical protein [Anaerolineales bacterium]
MALVWRFWPVLLLILGAGCSPAAQGPAVTLAVATRTPIPTRNPPTATRLPASLTSAAAAGPSATEPPRPSPSPTLTLAPAGTLAPASTLAPTADPALAAILSYLEARAAADVTRVTDLSCTAWKPQAVTEAVSFRSMNAKLQDVACQVTGTDGDFTLVRCDGKIITTYGPEAREWDLSTLLYQALPEAGEWKMCGYQ